MGIDYAKQPIKGSGPDGRIVKEDILAFAEVQKVKAKLNSTPIAGGAPSPGDRSN